MHSLYSLVEKRGTISMLNVAVTALRCWLGCGGVAMRARAIFCVVSALAAVAGLK
jgi:hypothetical protein